MERETPADGDSSNAVSSDSTSGVGDKTTAEEDVGTKRQPTTTSGGRKAAKIVRNAWYADKQTKKSETLLAASMEMKEKAAMRQNQLLEESNSMIDLKSLGEIETAEDVKDRLEFMRLNRRKHLKKIRQECGELSPPPSPPPTVGYLRHWNDGGSGNEDRV